MTADDSHRALLARWRDVRRARKEAEREEDHIKNELLLVLGAAGATSIDAGDLGTVGAYKTGSRTNHKDVAEELAAQFGLPAVPDDLIKRHTKGSVTWALRAPREWSDE